MLRRLTGDCANIRGLRTAPAPAPAMAFKNSLLSVMALLDQSGMKVKTRILGANRSALSMGNGSVFLTCGIGGSFATRISGQYFYHPILLILFYHCAGSVFCDMPKSNFFVHPV
jgi:hypothetical protein